MATKNDITGDTIASKPGSDAYRSNYDMIFSKVKVASVPNPLLTEEQQRAVDDTAGLEEVNKK